MALERPGQKRVSLLVIQVQPPAVQSQKHVGGEEGDALVPITERMVDDQGLEQRRGHLRQVRIVPRLRTMEGAFEETGLR
jgi:hypothetical protein